MMSRVSLKGAGFAVLSAGLIMVFFACMKPVNLDGFLEDEKVIEIIKGGDGLGVDIDPDLVPKLQWSETGTAPWTPLSKGGTVTVYLGATTPNGVTIEVSNSGEYDVGSISWQYDSASIGNGATLSVMAGTAPFDAARTYHLDVEGKIGGKPYSIYVFIMVDY